jgi:hypothetical protein
MKLADDVDLEQVWALNRSAPVGQLTAALESYSSWQQYQTGSCDISIRCN